MRAHPNFFLYYFVGNKTKGWKTGVSRKQNTSNFPRNQHFLPHDTHTQFVFLKHTFPFTLFPTIWCLTSFNSLSMTLSNQFVVQISNSRTWLKVSFNSNVQQKKVLFECSQNTFAESYSEPSLSNISKMEFLLKIVIF